MKSNAAEFGSLLNWIMCYVWGEFTYKPFILHNEKWTRNVKSFKQSNPNMFCFPALVGQKKSFQLRILINFTHLQSFHQIFRTVKPEKTRESRTEKAQLSLTTSKFLSWLTLRILTELLAGVNIIVIQAQFQQNLVKWSFNTHLQWKLKMISNIKKDLLLY